MYTNLATSQGYILRILQHFATELCSFSNFDNFFPEISFVIPRLKIFLKRKSSIVSTEPTKISMQCINKVSLVETKKQQQSESRLPEQCESCSFLLLFSRRPQQKRYDLSWVFVLISPISALHLSRINVMIKFRCHTNPHLSNLVFNINTSCMLDSKETLSQSLELIGVWNHKKSWNNSWLSLCKYAVNLSGGQPQLYWCLCCTGESKWQEIARIYYETRGQHIQWTFNSLPWRSLDLELTPSEIYDVIWNPRIGNKYK